MKQKLLIKEILESDIFEYLELDKISEEEKAKAMEDIMMSLQSRVMLRIADFLEEKGQFQEFENILNDEKTSDKQINDFLIANKVPVDVFTGEESIMLKAQIMGLKNQISGGKNDINA